MFERTLKKVLGYSIIARNRRLVGRWNMLEKIIELTNEYIESMPKKERKKYGQFFTSMETARFMAGLYNFGEKTGKVSVLDAGAGSGILSCAFIERVETIDSKSATTTSSGGLLLALIRAFYCSPKRAVSQALLLVRL